MPEARSAVVSHHAVAVAAAGGGGAAEMRVLSAGAARADRQHHGPRRAVSRLVGTWRRPEARGSAPAPPSSATPYRRRRRRSRRRRRRRCACRTSTNAAPYSSVNQSVSIETLIRVDKPQ